MARAGAAWLAQLTSCPPHPLPKVITIDDKTGEHTNLFQGIEGDIAALGTQIDGHGSRLGKLEQAQVTAADIDAKVEAAVVPLATKATTESLGRRIDALEDEVCPPLSAGGRRPSLSPDVTPSFLLTSHTPAPASPLAYRLATTFLTSKRRYASQEQQPLSASPLT